MPVEWHRQFTVTYNLAALTPYENTIHLFIKFPLFYSELYHSDQSDGNYTRHWKVWNTVLTTPTVKWVHCVSLLVSFNSLHRCNVSYFSAVLAIMDEDTTSRSSNNTCAVTIFNKRKTNQNISLIRNKVYTANYIDFYFDTMINKSQLKLF